jgi:uncharacterized protein (TIGR00251 family)
VLGIAKLPVWLKGEGESLVIALHIQPGAKSTEICGEHGDALKIRLAAPPVDGKANASLLAFLSKLLGLPKAQLALVSGHTSRTKRVAINGLTADKVIDLVMTAQ